MRHKLIQFALWAGLIVCFLAQAVTLEEKAPEFRESLMEVGNVRTNKELQTPKRKQQQIDDANEENVRANAFAKRILFKIDMVQLPTGIWMSKYEVTQRQWSAVMNLSAFYTGIWIGDYAIVKGEWVLREAVGNNPSKFNSCGVDCPVEQVTWQRLQDFLKTLNQQTNKHYRLPTEDEWNSACHAGYNTKYCGSNNIADVAWYEGNSSGTTHAVGQKQPNAWGLYDMTGNVWEWTNNCGDANCPRRIALGGSWFDTQKGVRSTYRFNDGSLASNSSLGFRLVLDP